MDFSCSRSVFLHKMVPAVAVMGGLGFGVLSLRGKSNSSGLGKRSEIIKEGLHLETVPVKNPAFLKSSTSEGTILSTRTPSGTRIAFRLDEQSEFVWDRIVNVKEYHQGKRVSVAQILGQAITAYGSGTHDAVLQECQAFLNSALESNVILVKGLHVVSKFHERRHQT